MDIFSNIRQIASSQGISLTELGIKAGLGSRSIYNWKNNSPTIDNLIKVAQVLNTDIDNILDIDSKSELSNFHRSNLHAIVDNKNRVSQVLNIYPLKSDPISHSLIRDPNRIDDGSSNNYQVRVPIIKKNIAGNELFSQGNVVDTKDLTFKHQPNGTLFIINASDDSMTPTIPLHSYVTVRQQDNVQSGEIAAILINSDIIIRRIRYISKVPVAIPDNVNYEPISLQEHESQILGKIIHLDVSF